MKILIVRFSSIGDILLTTPIIRTIKKQLNAEIHFLTKPNFAFVVQGNPYIDQVHYFENYKTSYKHLSSIDFNYIIDLQYNIKSFKLGRLLKGKYKRFDKLNTEKWLMVNFKIDLLPKKHIVDRYFDSIKDLGVFNDGDGLDYFIKPDTLVGDLPKKYNVLVLGAAHATKRISINVAEKIIQNSQIPIILLGGKDVTHQSEKLSLLPNVINKVGKTSFDESAYIINGASEIHTGDTGLMHLGAALKKDMHVYWGNTVPHFGMYPYYGAKNKVQYVSHEVQISCRPCSKLGFDACPKGHFKCMENQVV